MSEKHELREKLRLRRSEVQEMESKSLSILARLMALPEWQVAKTVLYYYETSSEVRTSPSLLQAWQEEKRVCFPCSVSRIQEEETLYELQIFQVSHISELTKGAYGIFEPCRSATSKAVSAEELDLILVPAIAFDESGYRLGSGFGYYDRFLKLLRPGALKVGLAFESQIVEVLPREAHDERVDLILSEEMTRVV